MQRGYAGLILVYKDNSGYTESHKNKASYRQLTFKTYLPPQALASQEGIDKKREVHKLL